MSDARREGEVVEEIRAWVNRMKEFNSGGLFWTSGKYDFDPLFAAYDALTQRLAVAEKENDRIRSIVKGVHGALCDASDIPVPDMQDDLYDSVMAIVRQRNALRAEKAAAEGERDRLASQIEQFKTRWFHQTTQEAIDRAEVAEADLQRVRGALERLGDWRLDKAREHVESLRRFAASKADHDFIDRFSGWLIFADEIIKAALTGHATGETA